ncbi:MAG: hypothetical protein AABW87_04120 [Nanoarchaeota archaeon]
MAKHKKEGITKAEIKIKKKKWVSILAPKEFNNVEVGESICEDISQLVGRKLIVSLMSLTNDPKKQNIKVHLKITDVKNEKANTEIVGYELSGAYIRRITRRSGGKIEDSFLVISKDNVQFRVKPLIIARYYTKRSVLSDIRELVRKNLTEGFKNMNAADLINSIMHNKVQKDIRDAANKIYPVGMCEIKKLERKI